MGCSGSKGETKNTKKAGVVKAGGKKASPKKAKKGGKGVQSAGMAPSEAFKFLDPTKYCEGVKAANYNTSAEGTEEGDYAVVDRLLSKGPATLTFLIKTSKVLDLGVGVSQFATETEEERDLRLDADSAASDAASDEEEGGEADAAVATAKKETFLRLIRSFDFHLRDKMTHYKHDDAEVDEEDLEESTHTMFKKDL